MEIASTYEHFRHEQTDAFDDSKRTRFDEFGHPIDTPTVEGFDKWGDAGYRKLQREALARVRAQEQAQIRPQSHAEARLRCNRLLRARKLFK